MRDKHILLIHFVLNFQLVFILVRALLLPRLALPMCIRQGKFVSLIKLQNKTMRNAILSSGGVRAVNVVLCECVEVSCEQSAKLEGISQIRNVQFEESGLRVSRAYQIGPGKQIPRES